MKLTELSAYEIIKEQELSDISSKGTYLRHKKTGARVCAIENNDENKVFYIGFRTPVSDSTGVTHIIEHTVLCGSEKYPLKDPFLELVKGSLNTFLNAMTYPDKTIYPVASCNEKDYDNLMDVYLDAVFHPNIDKFREIFKQEGWHYELDAPEGELTINGVVYNEMKGVYSNPDSVHDRMVSTGLYPDTGYANESGGDPVNIPELTYENYLEYYRKHYHPSNAYIYLYGDHDIAKRLDYIDREYLSKYERIDPDSEVLYQKPFDAPKEMTGYYGISEEDDESESTYISYNVSIEADSCLSLAYDTLFQVLVGMDGTPVKQALLDAGLGSEVTGGVDDGLRQPMFQILVKGSEPDKKDEFIRIIREKLAEVCEKGLNKKAILANLNSKEFDFRESDFGTAPKGLIYGINILSTWLYDDDVVFDELMVGEYFKTLREKTKGRFYEELIEKNILNNPHALTLVIAPKKGMNAEREEELRKSLAAYKSSLSPDEIKGLIEDTEKLHEYQETPNTPEELLCLPVLTKDDIEKKIRPISNIVSEENGIKFVYHDFDSNGIIYAELDFDIEDLNEKELSTFMMMKKFLKGCSTKKHTYEELDIERSLVLGGLEIGASGAEKKNRSGLVRKAFIRFKVLPDNLKPALELIKEMFTEYDFSDKNRMKQLLMRSISWRKTGMSSGGNTTAIMRARSYYSQLAAFNEILEGLTCYDNMTELSEYFDERIDGLVNDCYALIKRIYNRENMLVSLTCDRSVKEAAVDAIADLAKVFPEKGRKIEEYTLPLTVKNEGLYDAGSVQYVARVGNFRDAGFEYTGALSVLRTILSYDYLWGQVRVLGGAYGCMCGFVRNGDGYFVSYRDPNLSKTNEVYENAADFIENYEADERDILKSVIGTVSSMDTPLSPDMKGTRSFGIYLTGYSEADIQRERDEVLNVTVEDIRKTAPFIRAIMDQKYICVVGNENAIKDNKELFGEIRPLVR